MVDMPLKETKPIISVSSFVKVDFITNQPFIPFAILFPSCNIYRISIHQSRKTMYLLQDLGTGKDACLSSHDTDLVQGKN